MGFLKTIISGIGTNGGLIILGVLLPVLLSLIKTKKYGSMLDTILLGAGVSLSKILITKIGNVVGNIVEWFIIRIIIHIIMFPILSFILGLRKDNKANLEIMIQNIKNALLELLKKQNKK